MDADRVREFVPLSEGMGMRTSSDVCVRVCTAFLCVAILFSHAFPGLAWAEVTSYTVGPQEEGVQLTSVTVARDGKAIIYDAEKLVLARVTHFASPSTSVLVVPGGCPAPTEAERSRLLGLTLNAGLFNPGGQVEPFSGDDSAPEPASRPGVGLVFDEPIVNRPGDDIVLFELQRKQNSPLEGDPVHVGPLEGRAGLRTLTISAYDLQFDHPKAQYPGDFCLWRLSKAPASLAELEKGTVSKAGGVDGFKALAVGIDLSDLGYAEGEAVEGLFCQNTLPGDPAVDLVCVAGLPKAEGAGVLAKEPSLMDEFLEGPLKDVEDIVFAVRQPGTDHWYVNFGYYASTAREYPAQQRVPGGVKLPEAFKRVGRLCILHRRDNSVTRLIDDPEGSVRDPQVNYEGDTILFSYRKGGQPYYNLYEIGVDGAGLKQLTDGPYNDIEPTYMPDGGIMFCSDRSRRFVNCWWTHVATLYACESDGSGIRMISSNIEHDNTPWVLEDGRVLYMRWEYVDRNQNVFHHLWVTNPDGTGQMVFFGNDRPHYALLDAKGVPGTNKVVASFSPGHGRPEHAGYVTLVDPSKGPDDWGMVRRVSKGGPVFRDPYAFSDDCFLVARGGEILAMNGAGATVPLFTLPESDKGLFCHEPRPIVPRTRERLIPPRTKDTQKTGQLFLADIYEGRNMEGVERGEITDLLILEQLAKPVSFSGGMWPISIGGTFTLARVLGTAPVEEDGSAFMEVPAKRSLFFVALDKDGLSVKRMHSFLTVMPGESVGCVGCHEKRTTSGLSQAAKLTAMRRPPSQIQPIEGVPDVLDFPRDVQPILNKHCVSCHNPEQYKGRVDLSGDHSPLFSQSYWTITQRALVADGRNEPYGDRPPRTVGSSASPLLNKMDGSHNKVKLTPTEWKTVWAWIESSAPYAGTYAALGSGMTPVEFPVEMMERRCGECHGHAPPEKRPIGTNQYFQFGKAQPAYPLVHTFMDLQRIRAYTGYYKPGYTRPPQSLCNLSRPAMSLLLRAPLAKKSGGLGLCEGNVFANQEDADYQVLRAAIQKASDKLAVEKRFDMADFRPNDYYLHQMIRYGILPQDLSAEDPVDPYATDKAYWDSFEYSGKKSE